MVPYLYETKELGQKAAVVDGSEVCLEIDGPGHVPGVVGIDVPTLGHYPLRMLFGSQILASLQVTIASPTM